MEDNLAVKNTQNCHTFPTFQQNHLNVALLIILNFYSKLDTRISVRPPSSVTLRGPPLDSETGWTGELWSNRVLLILEN